MTAPACVPCGEWQALTYHDDNHVGGTVDRTVYRLRTCAFDLESTGNTANHIEVFAAMPQDPLCTNWTHRQGTGVVASGAPGLPVYWFFGFDNIGYFDGAANWSDTGDGAWGAHSMLYTSTTWAANAGYTPRFATNTGFGGHSIVSVPAGGYDAGGVELWSYPTLSAGNVPWDSGLEECVPAGPPPPKITFTINAVEFDELIEKSIRVEYNGCGSGAFRIARNHPDATVANLARGNIVSVTINEIHSETLFEWILEDGDFDLVGLDEGAEELSFSGPGTLAILRRARIHYNPEYDDPTAPATVAKPKEGQWRWVDQEAGDILERIIEEAEARGVLVGTTHTFTDNWDTDHVTWTPMGAWEAPIGADLYDEALRLVEAGQLVIEMRPGLVLDAWESHGVDRTATSFSAGNVRFVKGVNITDEVGRQMPGGEFISHMIVRKSDGTYLERNLATYPYKAEGYMEVSSSSTAVAQHAADYQLNHQLDQQEAVITAHRIPYPGDATDELAGIYLPGPTWSDHGQYWIGDLITLHTGTDPFDYDNETFRVIAITLTENEVGYLSPPIVELDAPWGAVGGDAGSGSSGGGFGPASGPVRGNPTGTSLAPYQLRDDDKWKQPVACATTANITIATALNVGDTIDGYTLLSGDRVLVKDQSTGSQNGIYEAGATPVRASDFDGDTEVVGALVYVISGTTNGGTIWRNTNATDPDVGTDALTFDVLATSSTPDLDDLANVDTTGKADGDVVVWDAATSTWIAAAQSGGSGGSGTGLTTEEIVLSGSTVSVTSGADATVLSLLLGIGTWVIDGFVTMQASSPGADYYAWLSDGSSDLGSAQATIASNLWAQTLPVISAKVVLASPTTITLKARSSGATGTAVINTPNGTKGKATKIVAVRVSDGGSSDYVSGAAGTGQIIVPGIVGSVDRRPSSPSSYDDEFESYSGWTMLGSVDTAAIDFASHLHLKKNSSSGRNMNGPYKAAPAVPFTVTLCIDCFAAAVANTYIGLMLLDSTPTKLFSVGWTAASGYGGWFDFFSATWTNRTTLNTNIDTDTRAASGLIPARYIRMVVTSSTSVALYWSNTGKIWYAGPSGQNTNLTIANVGIIIGNINTGSTITDDYHLDWIRFKTGTVGQTWNGEAWV